MVDITTVEEITAGDYTVRVGHGPNGYEAVVINDNNTDKSVPGRSSPLFQMMPTVKVGTESESDADPIGPPVSAPHRWVAVGFAIEAYEWLQTDEDTGSVVDVYEDTDVGGVNAMELVAELEDATDD